MTASFAPGFYTSRAEASSAAGDWRLAGWTPKVLHLPEDLGRDARRTVLVELGRTLGTSTEVTQPSALVTALAALPANTVLVWVRGAAFADAQPAVWAALADVLEARTKRPGAFAVVLAGADRKSRDRDR